jgi:hypothetical protein
MADPGAMVKVVPSGGDVTLPEGGGLPVTSFSPYQFYLDAASNNEGALVTLFGVG